MSSPNHQLTAAPRGRMHHTVSALVWVVAAIALFAVLVPSAGAAPAPAVAAQPAPDPVTDVAAAQARWASTITRGDTYEMSYRWDCPSVPGLECLGIGSAPYDDVVTVQVVDGVIVDPPAGPAVTVTQLLDLLALHSLELSTFDYDTYYGYPRSFEFGAPLCLGPPATPDDPGGCPGAPQRLAFELTNFAWGYVDPVDAARHGAQLAIWEANQTANYSFTLNYTCFCPFVESRIVVTNGVAEVIETLPLDPDAPQLDPITIDELMRGINTNTRDQISIRYDSDLGFATSFVASTSDPGIADGFFGFSIRDFVDHDAMTSDNAAARATWATHQPQAHNFDYQRSCFCPPPFGPVNITVIDGVVTDVVSPEPETGLVSVPTIDEQLAVVPIPTSGGTASVTFDPAWGLPTSITSTGPPGLADAGFTSTVTNFVPLNSSMLCAGRSPTQVGTDGDDVLIGTDAVDVIFGGAGDDQIYGLGGDDFLCGGSGNDLISGGDGNDHLSGDDGIDELHGLQGDDILEGGHGDDRIRGQAGNDRLVGGPGNDDLFGSRGDDTVFGESGDDRVRGGTGADVVDGGAGTDFVNGNGGEDTVRGGPGIDEVIGGPRPDVLEGGDGDDLLRGLGGADVLRGGEGRDELRGNQQNDRRLDGGPGTDQCNGGPGIEALATIVNCEAITAAP